MSGLRRTAWELVCYCFICVVGLTGNLIVCLVVLKGGKASRRFRLVPFNIYLMALAVVDLTLAVLCLPNFILSTARFPHLSGTKADIVCRINMIPFWLAGVSIYMLVIISFERCTAICKPFLAITRRTSRKTALHIAAAWLIGLVIQFPTIFGERFTQSHPSIGNYCGYNWPNEATSTAIYACTFTVQFGIPAMVFIVNFYRIQKSLRKFDADLRKSIGNNQQRMKIMQSKKKTVRIVFVVSAAFFVCWTPNNVMYFLFQYGGVKEIQWNSDVYQVGVLLGFFNSCINPFLYAFQSRDFRSHCRKVLEQVFRIRHTKRQRGSSEGTTSSRSKVKFRILSAET